MNKERKIILNGVKYVLKKKTADQIENIIYAELINKECRSMTDIFVSNFDVYFPGGKKDEIISM